MCHNPFKARYPTLWDLLQGTPFEDDAKAAIQFSQAKEGFKSALQKRQFRLSELMCFLCGAVFPEWADSDADQLESDLFIISGTLGIGVARTAYREKFLVEANSRNQNTQAKQLDAKNKLEDVRYEIAVTAKACAILDNGSIKLEKPILNQNKSQKDLKNSDVFGTFEGQPVRIEVTVLHEAPPPAIHLELDYLVRQADVSSGFRVELRFALTDHGYAERVRALIEKLHGSHVASNGTSVNIDGIRFEWKKGNYHCPQETSPFDSICFFTADEIGESEKLKKEVVHPCSVRPVTSKHVLEDHPNPPGVVTAGDLPDAPTQVPVSTKIGQMLSGKLQQCEDGVINIVAFGNPLPMHDRELENAVCGTTYVCVPFWTDKHGVRHSGKSVLQRDSKAPFFREQYLGNDDRIQFTEPFKKMSAVWQIRLGGYAKNQVIPNPNALLPIPQKLVEVLSDPAPSPTSNSTVEWPDLGKPESDNLASGNGQEGDIVWTEVAGNYVEVCGTLSEAQSVLSQLEQSGMSIDELRTKVVKMWSNPPKEEKAMKFFSPTKEEMAMTFVVDCGGYTQARACLEQYEEDEKQ
jgi:hypothetical protein